ncbi:hypothetical protein WR25_05470 [Diploscapter pachys]|uniref:Carbohydrate kinase PfkB domain-containing protein n=1 Tax=Diploscapter pachys TaxID=2018661 RepID=A0A2A2LY75_9BILA|nr:hypothetical protein WR25_05470 [Diploscapter pachys]
MSFHDPIADWFRDSEISNSPSTQRASIATRQAMRIIELNILAILGSLKERLRGLELEELLVTVFFNPTPGDPNLDKNLLKLVDIICINENEAEFITDHPLNSVENAKKQALEICKFGPKSAVITLGAKGVVISESSTEPKHVEVGRVETIDTTGAGDCCCGR